MYDFFYNVKGLYIVLNHFHLNICKIQEMSISLLAPIQDQG